MQSLTKFLCKYLPKQLENFFPDGLEFERSEFEKVISLSLVNIKECFSYIRDPYFTGEFENVFNYLNGDHYSMFLYRVSNICFKEMGNVKLAEKIFQLNRALHGIDAYYKIELPPVFIFSHPVGTILGGAKFGNFFSVSQGCTIGNKEAGKYPILGEGIMMFSDVSIIGDCVLGNNVILGAGSRIIDTKVNDNTLVLGAYPDNLFKEVREEHLDKLFDR